MLTYMSKAEPVAKPVGCGWSEWNKLYVRVSTHPGGAKYRAWTDDGTEFRGTTLGYTEDVYKILRRMISAISNPPEVVVKTAKLLFEHIEAQLDHVDILDDNMVGTAVDYKDTESPYRDFTLYIEVTTLRIDMMDRMVTNGKEVLGPEEAGFQVVITATYKGNDGYGIGEHTIKRKLIFSQIDPEVLWCEMMRTIRYAVNALPTE